MKSFSPRSSLRFSALSVGLVTLAGCAAPATTAEETIDRSSASLIGAPLDAKNTWSVGLCPTPLTTADGSAPTGTDMGNCTKAGSCTGSLVAPNLVLTARHCVEGIPTTAGDLSKLCVDEASNHFDSAPPDISNLRVTTSPSGRAGTPVWRKAKAVHLPAGVNACADDVALIELGENVPATEATPAAADIFTDVATNKPSGVAIVGRGVIDVQYDLDAGGILKLDRGDSQRRILEKLPFVCASSTNGGCTLDDYNFGIPKATIVLDKRVLVHGAGGAAGDSGAGVLDQTRFSGGLPAIIGVFSYVQTRADGTPGNGFAPRLSPQKDFIAKVASEAAKAGGYPTPAWVTAAPALAVPPGDGGPPDAAPPPETPAPPKDGGTPVNPVAPDGDDDIDRGCSAARSGTSGTSAFAAVAVALAGVLVTLQRRRKRA